MNRYREEYEERVRKNDDKAFAFSMLLSTGLGFLAVIACLVYVLLGALGVIQ